jgi:ubiquitin-like 1-activating enzyme E1 B
LFHEDIEYLLSMGKLWEERRKPVPLTWAELPEDNTQQSVGLLKDQRVWSIQESGGVFMMCVDTLRAQKSSGDLVWDKDDDICLDFVTAAANLRAHIFGIPLKSRFDIKCMILLSLYIFRSDCTVRCHSNGWKHYSCYCHNKRSNWRSHCCGGS